MISADQELSKGSTEGQAYRTRRKVAQGLGGGGTQKRGYDEREIVKLHC